MLVLKIILIILTIMILMVSITSCCRTKAKEDIIATLIIMLYLCYLIIK